MDQRILETDERRCTRCHNRSVLLDFYFFQRCQVKDGMNATAAAINFDNNYCSSTLSECINNKQDIDAIKLCVLCSTKNKYSVSNSHFLLVL